MLELKLKEQELYDESTQEFKTIKATTLLLEHSLVSLSKWEMKWLKPFLSKEKKTSEEMIDYIRCMTITQNVKDETFNYLYRQYGSQIEKYIEAPMTATTIHNNSPPSREIVTAEVIYYWMISLNIPFECQKWHLNRLMMLINVCGIKNQPKKHMSRRDLMQRNRDLNRERLKRLNTRG